MDHRGRRNSLVLQMWGVANERQRKVEMAQADRTEWRQSSDAGRMAPMSHLAFLFSGRTKDSVLYVVTAQPWRYRPYFARWLSVNWTIWERFEREASAVYERGRRHYSARTLIEFIRHSTVLAEVGGDFKINNNAAPDLARLYLTLYPEREGLFEIRDKREAA